MSGVGPRFAEGVASLRDAGRDRDESRLLACGTCGHINPDHRWTPPFDCLIPGCDCPAVDGRDVSEAEVEAAFDAVWPAA